MGFTKSIRSIWVSVGSQISAAATAFGASTHPFRTASLDVDMSIALKNPAKLTMNQFTPQKTKGNVNKNGLLCAKNEKKPSQESCIMIVLMLQLKSHQFIEWAVFCS